MLEHAKTEALAESLKKYVSTNYELIKLEATERSSVIGSSLISDLLVGISGILFVLFLSLWAGFYISTLIGDYYSGFAVVAGFYFLLSVILILGKKSLLEKPLRDIIIRKIFKK